MQTHLPYPIDHYSCRGDELGKVVEDAAWYDAAGELEVYDDGAYYMLNGNKRKWKNGDNMCGN